MSKKPQFDFKRWASNIKRKERAFKKMSRAEKRVAVARDVILAIRAEQIVPATMVYLDAEKMSRTPELPDLQVREALAGVECTACAIGSVFVACTNRADDLTMREFGVASQFHSESRPDQMRKYLSEWFSYKQLALIESAFERSAFNAQVGPNPSLRAYRAAVNFGDEFTNSKDRMIGIMKNIIKNEGTFKP